MGKLILVISMLINNNLKNCREELEITQEELGKLIGVTKVSICGYELGTRTPTIDNFILLADVLDVDPNYLLGRDNFTIREIPTPYTRRITMLDASILDNIKRHKRLYNYLVKDPVRATNQMEILLKRELK